VKESEQQKAAARVKEEELRQKIQELSTIKTDITVQLDRLRSDEQSAKFAIEELLNKYETTRMEVMQYHMEHQNDIPLAKYVTF
jgi:DNA gyrase/topoisomerase IV subunit B